MIGGDIPSRVFLGNLTFAGSTVTRANGSDTGSFLDEGLAAGMRVEFAACTTARLLHGRDDRDRRQVVHGHDAAHRLRRTAVDGTSINVLTRRGIWDGAGSVGQLPATTACSCTSA